MNSVKRVCVFLATLVLAWPPLPAHAEATVVRAAKQFGLGYLQLMIMEDQKLIEKHAKAAGLDGVSAEWSTFRSSDVMNDALLSGSVDFVSLGVPGMLTIWDKSKGNAEVKGVSGLNALPLALMVREPSIKGLKDFTDSHRIVLPAVKVSNQAILLQMAAEAAFGVGQHTKLDHLTVSMAHPDATAVMLGGQSEIVANFSSVPFQQRQAKSPAVRLLISSTQIMGGPFSFNIVATTSKFRAQNPKLFAAFRAGLQEATDLINADKKWAAETYLRLSKDKMSLDDLRELMSDPEIVFTTKVTPIEKMVEFMMRTGSYRNKPASAKDLMFSEAQ